MRGDYQDQSNWQVSVWFYRSENTESRKRPQLILVSVQSVEFHSDSLCFGTRQDVLDWKIASTCGFMCQTLLLCSCWCIQSEVIIELYVCLMFLFPLDRLSGSRAWGGSCRVTFPSFLGMLHQLTFISWRLTLTITSTCRTLTLTLP